MSGGQRERPLDPPLPYDFHLLINVRYYPTLLTVNVLSESKTGSGRWSDGEKTPNESSNQRRWSVWVWEKETMSGWEADRSQEESAKIRAWDHHSLRMLGGRLISESKIDEFWRKLNQQNSTIYIERMKKQSDGNLGVFISKWEKLEVMWVDWRSENWMWMRVVEWFGWWDSSKRRAIHSVYAEGRSIIVSIFFERNGVKVCLQSSPGRDSFLYSLGKNGSYLLWWMDDAIERISYPLHVRERGGRKREENHSGWQGTSISSELS